MISFDPRNLVGHRETVPANTPLEDVHRLFAHNKRDFLAVLDGSSLLGLCGRRDIAMGLGARFGFALYARRPVREHLVVDAVRIAESDTLPAVLSKLAGRPDDRFYDDVLLVDRQGAFLGIIFVHTLVRLQTGLLLENIAALERSQAEIQEKNHQMEEDLFMAKEVQTALLPALGATAGTTARWRFHSVYLPAGPVSGDFFALFHHSDRAAGVLVCDVMGHGVRAALITALLRAFTETLRPLADQPGALLTRLNRELMEVLRHTDNVLFVTAAYVFVDVGARLLHYGQAGHPTGFIRRAATGTVELLPAEGEVAGPAFGLIDNFAYETGETDLGEGDSALLFTDGLFEVSDTEGSEWGLERLRSTIQAQRALPCAELLPQLVAEAGKFGGRRGFDDDVCLVALETSPTERHGREAETSADL